MLSGQQRLPQNNQNPQQLVVFLHGYGANGDDLISLSDFWIDALPQTEFLAPNAPERIPFNIFGYQWFGLEEITPFNIRQGLDRAGPKLADYLQEQLTQRQMKPEQLVLVGFSQGTMMALEMLFHLPNIGGILGYSGAFVPRLMTAPFSIKSEVVLVHGTADTVVPFTALAEAQRQLDVMGVSALVYPRPGVGHYIDPQGLEIGKEFIKRIYDKNSDVIYL